MSKKGFTLIELIMVLVLISIVAAVAAPALFRGTSEISVLAFAKKAGEDIRYAQALAMKRHNLDTPSSSSPSFRYRIRFNVADANCAGANQYAIVNDADYDGTWGENPNGSGVVESARNPATGETYFCVKLDSGDFAGFTVAADFGGSVPGIIEFDTLGIPYDSDGSKLTASKTAVISKGGSSSSITITPNTGMVTVQ